MQIKDLGEYVTITSDKAINCIKENGSTIIYHQNENKLQNLVNEIIRKVRNRNSRIANINQQMIISSPFYGHAIDGCLHVYTAEIIGGTVDEIRGQFTLCGWNKSVLSEEVRLDISIKTLLALGISQEISEEEMNKRNKVLIKCKKP